MKSNFLKRLFVPSLLLYVSLSTSAFASNTTGLISEPLRRIPLQDGGRIKPYDTLANEVMELVHGKSTFLGRPAPEIVFTWLLQPELWEKQLLVDVKHRPLREALKLDLDKKHFSFQEIMSNDRLSLVLQELTAKRETKEKLNPYDQAVQRLESQIFVFQEITSGRYFRVLPPNPEGGPTSTAWIAVAELPEPHKSNFLKLTSTFVSALAAENESGGEALKDLEASVDALIGAIRLERPGSYFDPTRLAAEIHYNHFHPYGWALIFYFVAAALALLAWFLSRNFLMTSAWALTGLGLLLHLYGMALHIYLTGRPPVTNMYETVIWVAFGSLVFSILIEIAYRFRFVLVAGLVTAGFCLMLGDLAPAVLDSSLTPLEPVLRSQFWLTTHVLTITISYAAFFLAFTLSDIAIVVGFRETSSTRVILDSLSIGVYRSMQIGVALLAPGIILGGIWADYSWGRFWGWDPKETWALIVLLGYVAVLHGRLTGWIRQYGLFVSGVVSFNLVIMAWYGVNFILGAGLHSYGFGAGGVEYVAGFSAVHLILVLFSWVNHAKKKEVA